MPSYTTPGIFIDEHDLTPLSVAEVETAVPAFIGYTEKAEMNASKGSGEPVLIASLAEFEKIFGGAPPLSFGLTSVGTAQQADFSSSHGHFRVNDPTPNFRLYRSLQLYFRNGGGACYILSTGQFDGSVIEGAAMERALATLTEVRAPTLVVLPDAVSLPAQDCYSIQRSLLVHCARRTRNRMAILDVYNGAAAINESVTPLRQHVDTAGIGDFGAAYYPWVNTSLVSDTDLDYRVFDEGARGILQQAIAREQGRGDAQINAAIKALTAGGTKRLNRSRKPDYQPGEIDKILRARSATYVAALAHVATSLNLMPPSAAVAGVIVSVDTQRGVWKAPANVSLNNVVSPAVVVSDDQQLLLNTDPTGKSVNLIRHFAGRGTLIWGARTLAGNDPQWQYISVRRTCIMLEQCISDVLKAAVFEPNDAPLWSALKQRISGLLISLWRQGGLRGEKTEQAFFVSCGLGETMTQADLDAGALIVSVGVAMVRPAEFIVLNWQQRMQTP